MKLIVIVMDSVSYADWKRANIQHKLYEYTNVYTNGCETTAAHTTMLTGMLSYQHGVWGGQICNARPYLVKEFERLPFKKYAFITMPMIHPKVWMAWDHSVWYPHSNGQILIGDAVKYLKDKDNYFAMLNLGDTHSPYGQDKNPTYLSHMNKVKELLRSDIELDAAQFHKELEELREMQIYSIKRVWPYIEWMLSKLSDANIIVTSDHGENWGEGNNLGHGTLLNDNLAHIPFMSNHSLEMPLSSLFSLMDIHNLLTDREIMPQKRIISTHFPVERFKRFNNHQIFCKMQSGEMWHTTDGNIQDTELKTIWSKIKLNWSLRN